MKNRPLCSKENKPLVSICMPVYNGQNYLFQTLDSLIKQDYENIEIIILDNMSEDDTGKICKLFEKQSDKVRYIQDQKRVDVMEGHKRAFQYAKGELFMVACDDDIYMPTYVSTLMNIMLSHPDIGLVYSRMGRVSENGKKKLIKLSERQFLRYGNSRLYNFMFYLLYRCPVPLSFGLIKADLHREALKYYYRVDHRGWDHDNLYMLRLLSLAKVDSTKEVLFYYRQRDRSEQVPVDRPRQLFKQFLYLMKHQVLVSAAIAAIINNSDFSMMVKGVLHLWNVIVLVYIGTLKYIRSWLKSLI